MRKTVLMIIIILFLVLTTVSVLAYGEETEDLNKPIEIVPEYVYTSNLIHPFLISRGIAKCSVIVNFMDGKSVDYAQFTVRIKNSSGTVVKTFEEKKYKENNLRITWEGSYKLSKRGTYYAEVNVKLYKGGKVVETLTGKSVNATY